MEDLVLLVKVLMVHSVVVELVELDIVMAGLRADAQDFRMNE